MKYIFRFFLIFVLLWGSFSSGFAAINFTLTPIRYEIQMSPWETKTFPATIRNNWPDIVILPTAVSDFTARDGTGVPLFVRKSELVFPDQQLSTWISLSQPSVTVAPSQEVTIDFTISVPSNATPGGHYGAVFFKNPGSEVSTGWNIGINVDYGILILLTVRWDIDGEWEVGNPSIHFGGSTISNTWVLSELKNISNTPVSDAWYIGKEVDGKDIYQLIDSCPFGDFTTSRYDNSCISLPFWEKIKSFDPLLFENDFKVQIDIPLKNIGNTHLKPTGKIVLKDEDGKVIQAIGKETISNEDGATIGDKIVDYIPINDEGGNVLPQTSRTFESEWKGFPYKTYDEAGNPVIKYWSPSEYYTQQNKDNAGFLMFWERVSEVRQNKSITADIEFIYLDENDKEIVFNAAKEFEVQYIEQKITLNPYVVLTLLLLLTAGLMIWGALRWWILVVRTHRCWKCKETIKAHWETCPYCKTLQNKTEHKKFEKLKDSKIPELVPSPVKKGRKKKEIS